jgi:ABC transporter DrrB family efflux protein
MKFSSLWEMTKGRWREFCREPSAFFFVIAMPLLWMLILGHAFNPSKEEHYRVGLLEHGGTELEAHVKKILTSHSNVEVLSLPEDLKRGNIPLFVEVQNGALLYHQNINNKDGDLTRRWINDLIQTSMGRKDPIPSEILSVNVGEERYVDFLIPGLLALSIFTTSLFGTGMTIVSNRRENLLKRYAATPMNTMDYILSHIFGRFFIFAVEFSTIALGGFLFFRFNVAGSWLDYLLIGMLGVTAFTALSMLFSSRTKNTAVYNGIVNLLTLSMMFPAGIWFPRSGLPHWMHTLSSFLPLTALVEALRAVALEGQKLTNLTGYIGILLAYAVVSSLLAKKFFRWY